MVQVRATPIDQSVAPLPSEGLVARAVSRRAGSTSVWLLGLTALALLFATLLSLGLLVTVSGVPVRVVIVVVASGLLSLVIGGTALGYVLAASEWVEPGEVDAGAGPPTSSAEPVGKLTTAPRVAPRVALEAGASSWPSHGTAAPRPPQRTAPVLERTEAAALQLEVAGRRSSSAPRPITMPSSARATVGTRPPAGPQPQQRPVVRLRMPAANPMPRPASPVPARTPVRPVMPWHPAASPRPPAVRVGLGGPQPPAMPRPRSAGGH